MWCELDPADLDAFVDGEVTAIQAAEISAHVASCPSCRGVMERNKQVDDAIRRRGPVLELCGVREDLMQHVPSARRTLVRAAVAAAAIGAAFLIGLRYAAWPEAPKAPPAVQEPAREALPMLEALELDAASLRLTLVAEKPDPVVREALDARLDVIVNDIEKLRAKKRSSN
jgi:anti-sigma factor RsiW